MRCPQTLALLAALAASAVLAQQAPEKAHKEDLRFVLIVSRHGIRPPLTPVATLNSYSSSSWPAWPVPAGNLTPHGTEALRRMGSYMRMDFARRGLFDSSACPPKESVYLYSDTDQRNIASTQATFAAFAPSCGQPVVHTWVPAEGQRDPVFLPIAGRAFSPPPAEASLTAYREALGQDPAVAFTVAANPLLAKLGRILAPAPGAHALLETPVSLTPSATGDPVVIARGPLPSASPLAFNFLLEYADDKPLNEVAWGRLGSSPAEVEANLDPLVDLANKPFALSTRTPFFARAQASNLLGHILDTLQQAAYTPTAPAALATPVAAARVITAATSTPPPTVAAVASPNHAEVKAEAAAPATTTPPSPIKPREDRINGAFGPAGTKLVYISAHDSNIVALAGLLGLHWKADGRSDDTPPDSQLVFELWQNKYKHHKDPAKDDPGLWFVRIRYRAQTLSQLRSAAELSAAVPPVEISLRPIGCKKDRCNLAYFLHAARAALDPAYMQLDVPPAQVATR